MVGVAEQDVRGLDVAVDDPARVRGVERAGDLGDDVHRAAGVETAGGADERPQVRAVDVAHGDVERALVLARVVDRDHVGVIDRGGEAGLGHEALAEADVLGEVRGDQLERDGAIEIELDSAIDHAHAAAAGDADDAMTGEDVTLLQVGHDLSLYTVAPRSAVG